MSRTTVGWLWVAGQAVLLGVLILLPGSDAWPRPTIITSVASLLFFGGLALIAVAALRLGRALTPTPVPTPAGDLITRGLYRFMRHPIYTGVLLTVTGITLRSGSWPHAVVAIVTFVFFDRKAAWEEARLAERFPGYDAYAAITPKFLPALRRRHSRGS